VSAIEQTLHAPTPLSNEAARIRQLDGVAAKVCKVLQTIVGRVVDLDDPGHESCSHFEKCDATTCLLSQ
jgi:hypothetical protein